ncbi:hypothetical protein [Nocardia abscessus]|uniref:hypothetical protein n=1 Tax=Nocardia abscessus TaxID=120957 RepID=UPI002456FE06|nr:hypothetical protein [Nocardia abscessus]
MARAGMVGQEEVRHGVALSNLDQPLFDGAEGGPIRRECLAPDGLPAGNGVIGHVRRLLDRLELQAYNLCNLLIANECDRSVSGIFLPM